MASFSTSHHFTALTFLILFLKTQAFDPISSFSFTDFEKDPIFKSSVALYGNAKVVNGGSEVLLSGYGNSGSGKVMYKKPIKIVEGKASGLVSFSTYFAFSMSMDDGDGLAFVLVPSGVEGEVFDNSSSALSFGLKDRKFKVIGVQFSASRDGRNGGSASCNVAINVGSSVPAKIINTSSANLGLRSGGKLHAWIDYEASSRRLEVRLSQYGHSRPSDPLLWHSIDFSNVWEAKEMFAGFSPVKGNTSQSCFLYSWSFIVRHFPHWMHSEPLDPKVLVKNTETPVVKPRSDCFLRILAAMIFGAGCGALAAFIVLYLWTIFGNRRPVMPEEYVMQPVDFEYKKVNIVVDKTIKDAKE
ncbi:L-type lectin-domain containing receptor kinase VIII.2-like [Gastrolobium bilobum]|uniref:L-type lectin-domain containing receptor kinase VIII.2-like n=1 Tax=Gastrolobium bilobum TaxID=150636 RepID=UPI002AAFED0B|nr:L-type lectin-domain containing receptor kinase VIII.2-like [Gastrolobium bilobum]